MTGSYQNFKAKFIYEVIMVIIVIAVLGVMSVIGMSVFSEVNSDIQADSGFGNTTKTTAQESYDRYDDTMDSVILFGLIFMYAVILAIAWLSYESPLYLIILIILMLALIVVGAILSNVWDEFSSDTDLQSYAAKLPMTTYILDNYVMFVLVIITSVGLVMFMRNKL